jgi:hypothetical protein
VCPRAQQEYGEISALNLETEKGEKILLTIEGAIYGTGVAK